MNAHKIADDIVRTNVATHDERVLARCLLEADKAIECAKELVGSLSNPPLGTIRGRTLVMRLQNAIILYECALRDEDEAQP